MSAKVRSILWLRWTCLLVLVTAILHVDFSSPKPTTHSVSGFSVVRAAADIEHFAGVTHPVGSASHELAKEYLIGALRGVGLTPQVQQAVGVTEVANLVAATPVSNLIACYPGTASHGSILLTAHYDSVQTGPGAADDAAGVAIILETIRALQRKAPLRNDLLVVFTDGEEHEMAGAEALSSQLLQKPWQLPCSAPVVDLNFDNRGDHGPMYMFQTGARNSSLIGAFARTPTPVGSSLFAAAYDLIPNDTDFSVFKNAGLTGLNFAMVGDFQTYHTALDTPDHVDLRSVQQTGENTVALLERIGNVPLDRFTRPQGDSVFFDLLGGAMVNYSMTWVWPFEALSALLLIFYLYQFRHKLQFTRVLLGCAAILLSSTAVAALVGFSTNLFTSRFAERLLPGQTLNNGLLLCGLTFVVVALAVLLRSSLSPAVPVSSLRASVILVLWLLSALTSARLPGGSFLFLLPTVWLLLVGLFEQATNRSFVLGIAGVGLDLVAVLPALLLFVPLILQAYILLGINAAVAAFTGVMVTLLTFIFEGSTSCEQPDIRAVGGLSGNLMALAAILLVVGLLSSHASSRTPKPDTLAYAMNMDTHQAAWISFDQATDAWTSRVLGSKPLHSARPDLLGSTFGEVLWRAAPFTDLQSIAVVSKSSAEHESRSLQLHLQPKRPGERLQLTWTADHPLTGLNIAGRTVDLRAQNHQAGNLGLQTTPQRIELFGVPPAGVDVRLDWLTNAPKHITLVEFISGFSPLSQSTVLPTQALPTHRPAWFMPAPGALDNTIYVTQALNL